jgi:hypothetical protein
MVTTWVVEGAVTFFVEPLARSTVQRIFGSYTSTFGLSNSVFQFNILRHTWFSPKVGLEMCVCPVPIFMGQAPNEDK